MDNEVIIDSDPHIGLLHRGTEKLIESKSHVLSIPYFDRLDYVSMLIQEHAYCLAIEKIMNKSKHSNCYSNFKVLFDELTRILNHLMAVGSHTIDIGAMAPIFWAFEERENIMEFYERISGARMHAAFYRPNRLNLSGLNKRLLTDILYFTNNAYITFYEINNLIFYNKIWKIRMVNIGILDINNINKYGLTGVLARAAGKKTDLRLSPTETYASYYYLNFQTYMGLNGDTYDRYLVRMYEMLASLNICDQILHYFFQNEKKYFFDLLDLFYKKWTKNPYKHMEAMIHHFKYWCAGELIPMGDIYTAVESPKGEFGVFLITDGSPIPYRCKIRSPAYHNLYALTKILPGSMLADLITLIGSVDIVFGEIDR